MSLDIKAIDQNYNGEIEGLYRKSPDKGNIRFYQSFHRYVFDAYTQLRSNNKGFVAENQEGEVVGIGWISVPETDLSDSYALMSGLAVHPQWRMRGIAKKLTRRRYEYVKEAHSDLPVVACIQKGNDASQTVSSCWATEIRDDFSIAFYFSGSSQTDIRTGTTDSSERHRANVEGFHERFGRSVLCHAQNNRHNDSSIPVYEYKQCWAESGKVLGGAKVVHLHRIFDIIVTEISPRIFTPVYKLLFGAQLKLISIEEIWWEPGCERAIHHLISDLKESHEDCTIAIPYEKTGPVKKIINYTALRPMLDMTIATDLGEDSNKRVVPTL